MWDEARASAEFELGQLNKLLDLNSSLLDQVIARDPTRVELLAVSAVLHSFYMGVENIFKRIAQGIDQGLPEGPSWHKDLADSMAVPNNHRPAVISEELLAQLKRYLFFRHAFRNLYTFDLEWEKVKPLVANCKTVLDKFQKEIRAFFQANQH